jgi:hypothetical protein
MVKKLQAKIKKLNRGSSPSASSSNITSSSSSGRPVVQERENTHHGDSGNVDDNNVTVTTSATFSSTPARITSLITSPTTNPVTLTDSVTSINPIASSDPASLSVSDVRPSQPPLSAQTSELGPIPSSSQDTDPVAVPIDPSSAETSVEKGDLWDRAFNSLDEAEKKNLESIAISKGKEKILSKDDVMKSPPLRFIDNLSQAVQKIKDDDKDKKWRAVSSYLLSYQLSYPKQHGLYCISY